MTEHKEIAVVAADVIQGDVLIHFSFGDSVLFRASYLAANREQDGNVKVPTEDDTRGDTEDDNGGDLFLVPNPPEGPRR